MQYCHGAACTRDNKILTAVVYCLCLSVLGLDLASLGPALIQLAVKTSTSLTAVGYCFFFRSLAYMLASFLGPLYDKFPNPHFVLGAGVALAGIGTICVPFSTSVYFLAFIVMLQGVGMAVCDVGKGMGGSDRRRDWNRCKLRSIRSIRRDWNRCKLRSILRVHVAGCNVLLIYLWGSDVGPWMQLMVSPLRCVESFSLDQCCTMFFFCAFYPTDNCSTSVSVSVLSLRHCLCE
jgi:MFS family permease